MISQSNLIIGAVFVGFVVYITVKGELPAYLEIVGIGSGTTKSSA